MQPLAAHVGVVSCLPGQPAVVVIIIYLAVEPAVGSGFPYEAGLGMGGVHAAVGALFTHRGAAVAQGEGIVVLGIDVFAGHGERQPVREVVAVAHKRAYVAERAELYLRRNVWPQVAGRRLHGVDRQH